MAAFEYEALDGAGKRTRGLLSADSEAAARRELRRRRLAPLSVQRADEAKRSSGNLLERLTGPRAMKDRELMSATRQLATLIGSGMPVEEAVGLVGGQDADKATGRTLMGVRAKITEGERLSEAMSAHPSSFPPVYRAMVSAGEGSGGLGIVLGRLADYLEKANAVRSKVQTALIYPVILMIVAVCVITLLLTLVVPSLTEQFSDMGLQLPLLTRLVIGLSEFMAANGLFLFGGLVVMGVGVGFAFGREPVQRAVHRMRLSVPILGPMERKVEAARFARTMGILIASGTVLPDALRAARRASNNHTIADGLRTVIEQVETGRGMADALRVSKLFPPLMVYMVAAGERSGQVAEMFERSADHLENEVDEAITTGLSLLEPTIILSMGVIVLVIVLAVLLPMLQLNSSILQ